MVVSAWYMDVSDADQRTPHQCTPPEPVTPEQLLELGVLQWHIDADTYVRVPGLARARAM